MIRVFSYKFLSCRVYSNLIDLTVESSSDESSNGTLDELPSAGISLNVAYDSRYLDLVYYFSYTKFVLLIFIIMVL